MIAGTRKRSILMLAFTAASGVALILAGRAMAQQTRALPSSSRWSVLMFNPFDPVRTTTAVRPGALMPAPQTGAPLFGSSIVGPSLIGSSFLGSTISPYSGDPTGGTGGMPAPGRRPTLRDPFRPPTRSPVAPILGMD
jgi:hypothetical protein